MKQMLIYNANTGMLSLNQINVDGAYITDASIQTLKLANNSVTVPTGVSGTAWTARGNVNIRTITVSNLNPAQPTLIMLTVNAMIWGVHTPTIGVRIGNNSLLGMLACSYPYAESVAGQYSKKTTAMVVNLNATSQNFTIYYAGSSGSAYSADFEYALSIIHCKR
jgi:hypothetical protein